MSKAIVNKQGNLVKPRQPSIYGYALGQRSGTWCKKCADEYWLYTAYLKSEGTPDEWFFITKDKLYLNFQCSFCAIIIKDFPPFKFYKRWNWYNRINYIRKDSRYTSRSIDMKIAVILSIFLGLIIGAGVYGGVQYLVNTPTSIPESEWYCLKGQVRLAMYGDTTLNIIGDQLICAKDWKVSNLYGPTGFLDANPDSPLTFGDLPNWGNVDE